jgi:hypothetical protein
MTLGCNKELPKGLCRQEYLCWGHAVGQDRVDVCCIHKFMALQHGIHQTGCLNMMIEEYGPHGHASQVNQLIDMRPHLSMSCGTATGSCVRGALLNNDTHMPEDCSGSRDLQPTTSS